MSLPKMSQAGEPAPTCTWSQTSTQTPALQGGREGDQRSPEEVGRGPARRPRAQGAPLLSPKLGRAGPSPSTPPPASGDALPVYQVTKQSLASPGREGEVREVRGFFYTPWKTEHPGRLKLSHLGERWKNTHGSRIPSHGQGTGGQPTASPPHDQLSVCLCVCLAPSSLPPPTPWAFTGGPRTLLSRVQEARVVQVRKQVSSHESLGLSFPICKAKSLEFLKFSNTTSH